MQKRNDEWLLQLVSLLKDEQAITISLNNATSTSTRQLLSKRLDEITSKKMAYEYYEILAVYELLNKNIDDEKLFNILQKGSVYAKNKRKIVLRIARGKPSNDDTFNDFLMAIILLIVSKNLTFTTLITALMFAEKVNTLTYTEEEIIIKEVTKKGDEYD